MLDFMQLSEISVELLNFKSLDQNPLPTYFNSNDIIPT